MTNAQLALMTSLKLLSYQYARYGEGHPSRISAAIEISELLPEILSLAEELNTENCMLRSQSDQWLDKIQFGG